MKKAIEELIKPALVGKNPFDVEHLASAWGAVRTEATRPGLAWTRPCWDIIGKARNMPVYRLLATDGGPTPHIRMYASGGVEYAWYKRPEGLIDEAVRHKEAGLHGLQVPYRHRVEEQRDDDPKYIPYLRKNARSRGPEYRPDAGKQHAAGAWNSASNCVPVLEELKFPVVRGTGAHERARSHRKPPQDPARAPR